MTDESVLQEAHRLIHGDRNRDYGSFADDYGRTVTIFNTLTGRDLSVWEGVMFMACVKLSRMAQSPNKRDHYVDLPGYIAGAWQVTEQGEPTCPR